MTRTNTTFCNGAPTWANACVGDNGFPGYWEYATGFSQAANLLLDNALLGRGLKYSVDEFVYPICFNMRHSVELRLKGAISELISLEECRGQKIEFDLAGSHDIGNIWKFFVEKSTSIDDRYIAIVTRLETKIADIAEIDATGQTFRYPLNTESQKHLVDVAIINFVKLKLSFSELEQNLDELHRLNVYLLEEYLLGTLTKRLSRKNIFEIASMLPERSNWREESFCRIRDNIKKQFSISGKEFSRCVKIIERHYEFAPIIGMSVDLLGVSEKDIMEFVKLWFVLHSLPSDSDPVVIEVTETGIEAMLKSLDRDDEVKQEVWKTMASVITPEILAGLSTLFYFGDELDFSERYVRDYENNLRDTKVSFEGSGDDVRSHFFHIFDKTNGIYNILRSLYFLKKVELAEKLVSAYNLESKFSWLGAARNWSLFEKPKYCGYT